MIDRRLFLQAMAAGGMASGLGTGTAGAREAEPARKILSETGCGRATGYSETNKIVTWEEKTHVAWLDSVAEGFRVRVRTLDRGSGTWSPVYTVGEAYDNHGGPALTVDSKGHLHIVYYPHHHPFRYRRSLRPNDASEWSEEIQFGERLTYSSLLCAPDDTLYFACRERGEPWTLNFYRKPADGEWEGPTMVLHGDEPGGYTRWQASLAFGPERDVIHMGFMIYEGNPGIGYAIGYLRSRDGGSTWERSDGTSVDLPARPATVEAIQRAESPKGPENYRPGSIAVDTDGRPWLLYSRLDSKPFAVWLARCDGPGKWHTIPLLPIIQKRWPDRGVQTPGEVVFGADGTMYVALTTVDADGYFWGDESNEVVLLVSRDGGERFEALPISDPDPNTAQWLPSLERPTGHNVVDVPGLTYTRGGKGQKNTDILSNQVIWADIRAAL